MTAIKKQKSTRNGNLFDMWSLVHLGFGLILGWLIPPVIAILLMVAWEPIEIFVLSPILGHFGIIFGFENLRNSLSDIVFDVLGVLLGTLVFRLLVDPPFQLF